MSWSNPWAEGMLSAKEIAGKTIESTEVVPALYGTTPDAVLLLRFTDGTRSAILLTGTGGSAITQYARMLDSDSMRKAPRFFTEEEVAAEVVREMQSTKQREREARERKQRDLERLQRELGVGS